MPQNHPKMPHPKMPFGYLEMPHVEMPVSRDAGISRCCRISRWGILRYRYPEMIHLEIQYAEITVCRDTVYWDTVYWDTVTRDKVSRDAQSQDASRFYNMTTLRLLSSPAARRCLLLYRRAASPAARTREPRPRACAPGCSSHDSNRARQQRSRQQSERTDPSRLRWQT